MKKLLLVLLVFALGYGYGRWYAKGPASVAAATKAPDAAHMNSDMNMSAAKAIAKKERKILYYHDPMHPAYKSDKPGVAPDCGMDLEPVYADDDADARHEMTESAAEHRSEHPGAIYVSQQKQQLIGVEYGTVAYGPAFDTVRGAAKVQFDENTIVRVATKQDAWIDHVDVKLVGTTVKKNQQLLTLFNPQAYAAQKEFVPQAKARMANSPTFDQASYAAAKLKLQVLGFSDEDIEAIERSGMPQFKLGVYAPVSGVVVGVNAVEKQKVMPDALYTIADLTSIWVTADFPETEASFLREGQMAMLHLPSMPNRTFHGRVDAVLPQLDPVTRTVKARITFDNKDLALKPEMLGTVEIKTGGAHKLTVPEQAVLNSGLKQIVFVDKGEGYLEPRTVKIGAQYGNRVEVLNGLKRGEHVVTSGNFLIDSEAQLRDSAGRHD
jgi:Cu(I)/Ag(I) efflux system membrane fusion protein